MLLCYRGEDAQEVSWEREGVESRKQETEAAAKCTGSKGSGLPNPMLSLIQTGFGIWATSKGLATTALDKLGAVPSKKSLPLAVQLRKALLRISPGVYGSHVDALHLPVSQTKMQALKAHSVDSQRQELCPRGRCY